MNIQFFESGATVKKAMLSVGVAMALGMTAVSAQATIAPPPYDLGTVDFIGKTIDAVPTSGSSFTDVFDFTLKAGSGSSVGINSFFTTDAAPILSFTLQKGNEVALAPVTATATTDGATVSYGYVFNGLSQGSLYHLTVAGNSGLVDSYSIQVTAVPEPESYALLLAGLGLMGTIIRRRKAI